MATQQQPGAMGMAQYAAADGDQQKRRRKEGGECSHQLASHLIVYAYILVLQDLPSLDRFCIVPKLFRMTCRSTCW